MDRGTTAVLCSRILLLSAILLPATAPGSPGPSIATPAPAVARFQEDASQTTASQTTASQTTASRNTATGERRPELLPLPDPELDRLDPQLARQLEELGELIRRQLPTAEAAELADAFAELGHLYTYYEMPAPALTCYENAHRLEPDNPDRAYYRAFLLADLGENQRAVELFEEVLRSEPDDLASLARLGDLHLDEDRSDTAETAFRRILEIDPRAAVGWYGLGRVAARRGDHQQAVRHFEKTLQLQPSADLTHYSLGQSLRRLGKIDEAREALERRGTGKVSFPDPRVDRLKDATSLSTLKLVRSLAADRNGFPDEKFLNYTLSQLASLQGAVEHLVQLLRAWPEPGETDRVERARLHYAVGGLLIHKERPDEAIEHLRTALELQPDLTDARVKLANALARQRRFEEAMEQLSLVLEEDPDHARVRLKRAASAMALGRWEEAAADLFALEDRDPNNFEVRGRLAATLAQLGRTREAVSHFRAAARLDPSGERAARAHVQAATLLLREGDPREALPELRRAVELVPEHLDARLTLAGLLVRQQRYEAALDHFEQLLGHHPEAVPGHLGRATVLLLLGRYPEARAALEESLEALGSQPAVTLLLTRVLAAAPDPSVRDGARAETLARRLDEARPTPRSAEARALAAAESGRFPEAVRWQREAVERARRSGQTGLASYLERRISLFEAGQSWHAGGPGELIVLPGES